MNPIVSFQLMCCMCFIINAQPWKSFQTFLWPWKLTIYVETFSRKYIFYSFAVLSTFFLLFRTGEFGIIWLFKQCLLTRKVLIVLSKTKMSFRFFPHLLSRISRKPQDFSISSVILTAVNSIFLECSLLGYFFTFHLYFFI